MPRPNPRALERGGASNIRIGPRSGLVVCKRDHWGPLYTNHWVGPRSGLDVIAAAQEVRKVHVAAGHVVQVHVEATRFLYPASYAIEGLF